MIQVVLPLCGKGMRFQISGDKRVYKPFYVFENKMLLSFALSSFLEKLNIDVKIYAVILKEDNLLFSVSENLLKLNAGIEVIELDKRPAGPLLTVMSLDNILDQRLPICILDCDIDFRTKNFLDFLNLQNYYAQSLDAVCLYFKGTNPQHSFLKIKNGAVEEVREKNPFTDNSLAGCYFFSNSGLFFSHAKMAIQSMDPIKSEYYISFVMSSFIRHNLRVHGFELDFYRSLGSLEEIKRL